MRTEMSTHTASWIQQNYDQMQNHPAWHPKLDEKEAEELLKGRDSFSYIFRSGGEEYSYVLSFVKENGSIKHQSFVLEVTKQGWYYRNGCIENIPEEIVVKNLGDLTSRVMHCTPQDGVPVNNRYRM